jgi:TetR/AcrR family transcriptional regulator, transcriptional repressor for nem operon
MTTKAQRTRQFIIEKTASVFNRKGFAGTSLNDIVNATGLTKGSIYGNFEKKDDVALAAFDYNYECVATYLRNKMDTRSSVIDKLLVYPETYRHFFKLSFLHFGCPIANVSTEADDTHPQLKEKASAALHYWRISIERQLQAGIANKEIRSDINIPEVVSIISAVIQGSILQAKVSGKLNYLNASMDFLERIIKDLKK